MMIRLLLTLSVLPTAILAEVPRVMTDIAPVHSLTAQVMGDVGVPDLLLPPGADPHDFAMRPSDATDLGVADLVIWVGDGLTPWLAEPLATLAPDATQVALLETSGWTALEVHNDDAHDHDHDHDEVDPHAWLDPEVAQVWLDVIAAELAKADPANAAIYQANAAAAKIKLEALAQELSVQMAGLSDRPYILPHEGYQYFENRFGVEATAAIAGIDARAPGPAQVAALRDAMEKNGVVCVFSDAEIGDRWAALVIEGTDARTAQLDGVGAGLVAGPALYGDMMRRLSDAFATCLRDGA